MIYDLELAGVEQKVQKIRDSYDSKKIKGSIALAECDCLIKTTFPILKKYDNGKYEKRIYSKASLQYGNIIYLLHEIVAELKYAEDRVTGNLLSPDEMRTLTNICNELFSFTVGSDALISKTEAVMTEICTLLYWHTEYFRQYSAALTQDNDESAIGEWCTEVLNIFDAFLPQLGEALINKVVDALYLNIPCTLFQEIVHLLMQFAEQEEVITQLKDFLNKRSSADANSALFHKDGTATAIAFYFMLSTTVLVDMPLWMQGDPMPMVESIDVRTAYIQALYFAIMTHNSSVSAHKEPRLSYIKERLKPFLPAGMDVSNLSVNGLIALPAFRALLPELKSIAKEWNLPRMTSVRDMVFENELLNKEDYDRRHPLEQDKVSLQAQKSMGLAYGISSLQSVPQPVSTITPTFVLAQT